MKNVVIIPARYDSTRFPGKPLAEISGKSMIERVWLAATNTKNKLDVFIATDDERIRDKAQGFGANVVMTSKECRNGTERASEALNNIGSDYDVIINLQGDTPLIMPDFIDSLVNLMKENESAEMGTLAALLCKKEALEFYENKKNGDSTGTMVVLSSDDDALYFSRSFIPFPRDGFAEDVKAYRHIGIYAFRLAGLKKYMSLPEGELEKVEKLEQLRALENNVKIKVARVSLQGRTFCSVDTPEDLKKVAEILKSEGEVF